ncbi:MAG: FAD-binding oxidoreductase [Actinomycetota bacterium]
MRTESPSSAEEAAEVVGQAEAEGLSVRPAGRGTKLHWGRPAPEPDIELCTHSLGRIVEHNTGDLTAVVEPGVRLADARRSFAEAGQMLVLDPPGGRDDMATIGGIVATGDSGPLRHRYGGARDILLGMTVVLADGSVAKSGGKVIKNVAGYDLAKLFAGSYGTLGFMVQLVVRLHPSPQRRVSARGHSDDPNAIQRAAVALAAAPLELEVLDLSWEADEGALLAGSAGAAPEPRARRAVDAMKEAGLDAGLVEDDDAMWTKQGALQRSSDGAVMRVSGRPSEWTKVLHAVSSAGASVVGRAALGLSWVRLKDRPPNDLVGDIEDLRQKLHPWSCVVLDAPAEVRDKVDVWGAPDPSALRLMRSIRARFDPKGMWNPGVFVGGI